MKYGRRLQGMYKKCLETISRNDPGGFTDGSNSGDYGLQPLKLSPRRQRQHPPLASLLRLLVPGNLLQMCCMISFKHRVFETGEKKVSNFALLCSGLSQLRKHEGERLGHKGLWISGQVLWSGSQEEMTRSSPLQKLAVIHNIEMHVALFRAHGGDCDRIFVVFIRRRLTEYS